MVMKEIKMLMSKEAYARHSGVSCQTVDDWVAGGAEVVMSRSKVKICSCVWGTLVNYFPGALC